MKNILILVPTKNSWLYLPRLVDSLKKQTDANFRVIFVDSNSCSKHKKYLLEIKKDPRFIFYNQNDNYKGIYGAMNNGIEYAKKMIGFYFGVLTIMLIQKIQSNLLDQLLIN